MSITVEHAVELANRLRVRRAEIEQAVLTRVFGIGDPTETEDSVYVGGFRAAAAAAVDFGLATVESPTISPAIPLAFLQQAQLAARNRVRLDTVLRRYSAGHAVLTDFLIEELEQESNMSPAELRELLAASSAAFDRLLHSVGEEYTQELAKGMPQSHERVKIELVERLLAGEHVDTHYLSYPLAVWHIGMVLEGVDPCSRLRELAGDMDRTLLLVEPRAQFFWAWLGGRSRINCAEVMDRVRQWGQHGRVGIGEAAHGAEGWRLSHKQALAVLPLADGGPTAAARYADKGLIATVQKDQVLVESLQKMYLDPLAGGADDGEVFRRTLSAYFAADCNITSAASALKVHRQTVTSRLRVVEERLGESVSDAALELNLALRLSQTPSQKV